MSSASSGESTSDARCVRTARSLPSAVVFVVRPIRVYGCAGIDVRRSAVPAGDDDLVPLTISSHAVSPDNFGNRARQIFGLDRLRDMPVVTSRDRLLAVF